MKRKITILIIGILLGTYIGGYFSSETVHIITERPIVINEDIYANLIEKNLEISISSIKVPGVGEDGKGVATVLTVQLVPGEGRVLTNIDKLLFWTDTQTSIRTAKKVAEDVTGIKLSDFDIIYSIHANASVIEGPSAGAALTIATIAVLQDKVVSDKVMITGTINPDGTIGPVGGIIEKAKAAKDIGADTFLVPLGQSSVVQYEEKEHCDQLGVGQICTTERIPHQISASEEADIKVIEIQTIEDAIEYFFEEE
ncbi:MAG: S16 family serine protease [Nanoarchaeota archaeon]